MSAQITTQQALESYLWGAATILPGLVDAGDYKQYVFTLLFYKRLSDVWNEEFTKALADTGDTNYSRETANDCFIIPDNAHWKDVLCTFNGADACTIIRRSHLRSYLRYRWNVCLV
ncbi:MAG: type I restriction-modification system subunit M N-terminal domain-containing protein [Nostoc sp.]|uniref:type I restriction-modification system subunit M N-terminal domain-containing protein n=1 Tax=Nostoc sp. TaxID=1180 RepID=UPI002FF8D7FE